MAQRLFVTGASGQLGQRVIAHLLDTHKIAPADIGAGTRAPEKLAHLAARGVQIRPLDFEDGASLERALSGVERMLLISTDAVDRPGRRLAQHRAAVQAARKAGVKHVVYTSMLEPEQATVSLAPDHLATEQALAASGMGWTLLRNSWYAEFLLMALPPVLATGKWFTSAGQGLMSYVSREDCARAAAAALAAEPKGNARYDITGPEKHTMAQIAALVSDVFGKPVEVVQLSDEQLAAGMKAAGVPDFAVGLLVELDANTRAGHSDVQSDAVQTLTGKPPQSLREFLIANKAAVPH